MGLWSELNIDCRSDKVESTCFFQHPQNHALKIFVFADVPHLIKLLRNHFFDSGFEINGQLYTKRLLEELLALNSRDLKIAFNLTQKHLDVRNQQQQSVKLAAQIFSRRNALAIKYCGEHGFFSEDQTWDELSKMLLLINDWFDVCNSQGKYGQHGTEAYGVDLKNQDEIFDKMSRFVLNLRVKRKSHLLPFQKGILLMNASLKGLLQYLKETYSFDIFKPEYIITRRLCQDVLENFFSYIRAMGAGYDHPTPVGIQYRLKSFILVKHSDVGLSIAQNTEDDPDTHSFMDLNDVHADELLCTSECFEDDNIDEDDLETALSHNIEKLHSSEIAEINNHVNEESDDPGDLIDLKLLLLNAYRY